MVEITKMLTPFNFDKGNLGRKYIVIHYTGNATDTAKANANFFRTANRGASAHYFVDETSIYQVVEDDNTAWAVGRNFGGNNLFGICTNGNSLSIEMCSTNGRIATKTFDNTVELTAKLMKKYGISIDRVVRHYDVCSKSCPGWAGWIPPNEDIWKQFKSAVKLSGQTVTAKPIETVREELKEMSECYIQKDSAIYYFNYATKVLYHVPNPNALKFMQTITSDQKGTELKTYKHTTDKPYFDWAKMITAKPNL